MRCSARPICARDELTATVEQGRAAGAVEEVFLAHGAARAPRRQTGSLGRGRATTPTRHRLLVDEAGLGDYSTSAIAHVATARVALHEARQEDARAAMRARAPPAADARPRDSLAGRPGRARARARPSRARRRRRCSHGAHGGRTSARGPPAARLPRRGGAGAQRPARGDHRAGRCLGDEPDGCGAPAAPVPRHPSHVPGDRQRGCSSRATPSRPKPSRSTASWVPHRAARRSSVPWRSGCWRARSTRRGRISPSPGDAPSRRDCSHGAGAMNEYKEHLRRLAVHDEALLDAIAVDGISFVDARTAALLRVAATVAVDAAPSSFQHAVALALAAGRDEQRDRRLPRSGDTRHRRRACRPVRAEDRTRARLRRRRRTRVIFMPTG